MHDIEMVLAIAIAMVCETYRMGKSLWYLVVVFAMVPAMDQKKGFAMSLATPSEKVLVMGRILFLQWILEPMESARSLVLVFRTALTTDQKQKFHSRQLLRRLCSRILKWFERWLLRGVS